MNTVTVRNDTLTIEPLGLDKLWSFTSHIDVPLAHVRGATADAGVAAEPKGLRGPGLGLPGKTAGTFRRDGDRMFWNVSDPTQNVVIELADEPFDRVIITVSDPTGTERMINGALSAR